MSSVLWKCLFRVSMKPYTNSYWSKWAMDLEYEHLVVLWSGMQEVIYWYDIHEHFNEINKTYSTSWQWSIPCHGFTMNWCRCVLNQQGTGPANPLSTVGGSANRSRCLRAGHRLLGYTYIGWKYRTLSSMYVPRTDFIGSLTEVQDHSHANAMIPISRSPQSHCPAALMVHAYHCERSEPFYHNT